MSYYRRHVFVCENHRDNGDACCAAGADAAAVTQPVKLLRSYLQAHNMHGKGRTRINRAGCCDRCPQGPVIVVYPDNIWYRYQSENDLREIAQTHLIDGRIVDHLRLAED